jgi:hypothetical protein
MLLALLGVIASSAFCKRLKRRITPDQRLRPLAKGQTCNAIQSLKRRTGVALVSHWCR